MKRILSIRLENESGALSRVVGLFSQRGYNIETITVAPTEDPSLSHMTIQTVGDEQTIEQIEKQLHKLIDVLRVTEIGHVPHIERELILIKVYAESNCIKEIKNIVEIFKGKIVDMTTNTFTIEISGTSNKIDAFINIIRKKVEIIDISRSGIVGIARS